MFVYGRNVCTMFCGSSSLMVSLEAHTIYRLQVKLYYTYLVDTTYLHSL